MAIFPRLECEDVVQVGDKTRISASKSFVSKGTDAITKVEIEPESGAGFIEVTGTSSDDWFLDWVYDSEGAKTITVRVTSGEDVETDPGPPPVIDPAPTQDIAKGIDVVSEEDDRLFSSDAELISLEPDILKWTPAGRSSFLNIHRQAQKDILAWLDEQGYRANDGSRLNKASIVDLEEVRSWAVAHTLKLIFYGISNQVDDVFMKKAAYYDSLAINHRNRAAIRLDLDGDGEIGPSEGINIKTLGLIRR